MNGSPTLTTDLPQLVSQGIELDMDSSKVGVLRDSSAIAFDAPALRERLEEDGYLFLPGLLDRDQVLAARRTATERLMAAGALVPGSDPMEALAQSGARGLSMPDLTRGNDELMRVLYDGAMMAFYERLLGEEVRHFDFTWFRAVAPGVGTPPHTDAVYMNRGTLDLFTSWTPLGDIDFEQGGLMMLENSHRHAKLRANYSTKDVDAFCENIVGPDFKGMGGGGNIRDGGYLSHRPDKLREAMGGRWLTTEFRAGDLLMFSIFTVHASADNRSGRVRLSSDSRYQRASAPADERWVGANPVGHGPNAKRGMIC